LIADDHRVFPRSAGERNVGSRRKKFPMPFFRLFELFLNLIIAHRLISPFGARYVAMRNRHVCLLFVCVTALCTWSGVGRADVFYTYGYTPRGIGMGGAMTAVADDFAAAYYNPAGAAFHPQPSVGIGYLFANSRMLGIGINAPKLDETRGLLLGIVLPIPFGGFLQDRIAFSLASFFPNDVLLGIDVPLPKQPQYPLLQNSGRSLTFIPTLGVKILEGLSVGGGAQVYDNTSGEWRGRLNPDGSIQATATQAMIASFWPTAGLMFRPGVYWPAVAGLRVGLVFRDQFYTHYTIPVVANVSGIPLALQMNAVSLYTPRQYVAGVSYAVGRWLFALDGSYNEWSNFPSPSLEVRVRFPIPLLPISFRNSVSTPPRLHDTLTVRTGIEAAVWQGADGDFLVRAGAAFDPSPVPPQAGDTNFLDNDRYIGAISLGWRWLGVGAHRFTAPLVFDVGGQAQYLPPRITYKNEEVDPDNPGYPKVGFRGWLFAVGASLSVPFDYE
jgi:long-chain fatty acid transport protein